jgi:hypothetical protein
MTAAFETPGAAVVGLRLQLEGDDLPLTVLLDTGEGRLFIVRGGEGLEPSPTVASRGSENTAALHVFVDHGVVEAYGGSGCIAGVLEERNRVVSKVEAVTQERRAGLHHLDAWALQSIWEPEPAG